ncbi:hypothetical protein [Pedobacter sp. FW305-3-2-15-E-R2A2]|uniref:hypothetical protein n=1 Tax=Pedobacter sp. FW305-3-2-15-E-R2A2 TaxID=3140251 RepID=UPI0031404702
MIRRSDLNLLFLLKLLFIPILYELVIGGGGRYLELGPLSFRMLFFGLSLAISFVYYMNKERIRKDVAIIIMSFTIVTGFSALIGVLNGADKSLILADLKPLLFFYILLFFSLVIKDIDDIKRTSLIIKRGSVFLAGVYILVIILLFLGRIDFNAFYQKQNEIGEVMFKNDSLFFYKGFLYLCIGFFFFLFSKEKYSKLALLLLFVSILLTLTRGFILFTALIAGYYIFFINKNNLLKGVVFLVGLASVIIIAPIFFNAIGDKSDSDNVRYIQMAQVFADINPLSIFIGHGFGIGVPIRPKGMEMSFLEIFHKQGLVGLGFWFGMFSYIFLMYLNIKNKEYKELALPFLLSVVFVILQSGTNPYMNNPIGLTVILITIVVFSKLSELQKKQINDFSLHSQL